MAWYNNNWNKRRKVTVSASEVDSNLSNFPVYVDIGSISGISNAGAIRVTKADGSTELAREIVSSNDMHFKADSLSSSSDTDFYIYYDNSGASDYSPTDTYGRNAVWTNSFGAVYHMNDDPATGTITDSTGNTDLITNGSMTSADSVTSQVGNGIDFDGSDDYLSATGASPPDGASELTISAYFNSDQSGVDAALMGTLNGSSKDENVGFRYDAGGFSGNGTNVIKFAVENQSGTSASYETESNVQKTSAQYLSMQWTSGNEARMYEGSNLLSKTASQGTLSGSISIPNIYIGAGLKSPAGYWDGIIDEVRWQSADRTASWRNAEFTNLDTPTTFYTVGSEEINTTATISVDYVNATFTSGDTPGSVRQTDSSGVQQTTSDGVKKTD